MTEPAATPPKRMRLRYAGVCRSCSTPLPDLDAYFAQFGADAVVEDEGHLYRGVHEIRRWRTTVRTDNVQAQRDRALREGARIVMDLSEFFSTSTTASSLERVSRRPSAAVIGNRERRKLRSPRSN